MVRMVGLRGGRGGRTRREDHDEDELEVSASSSEEVYICMYACVYGSYMQSERERVKEDDLEESVVSLYIDIHV